MKRIQIAGLCLLAVFAFSAVAVSTASAKRVWLLCKPVAAGTGKFTDSECKTAGAGNFESEVIPAEGGGQGALVAKIKAGQVAMLESEVLKNKIFVECNKVELSGAEVYNAESLKTGRDKGVVKFLECSSAQCKLTAASEAEIRVPPKATTGMSALAENKLNETPIYDNFLPEGKGTGETEGVFAEIGIKATLCGTITDVVKSNLTVGELKTAKEGEGGVAAEVTPPLVHKKILTFKFPCPTTKKVFNWEGNEIKVGEFADFINGKKEGPAQFCALNTSNPGVLVPLEIEVELASGDAWGVK
jgi:hypothetical protein